MHLNLTSWYRLQANVQNRQKEHFNIVTKSDDFQKLAYIVGQIIGATFYLSNNCDEGMQRHVGESLANIHVLRIESN